MDPLSGTRVLDFGSFITAPYAAMLLAEYGADVVKIERPGMGDPFRAFGKGLYSPQFQAHNHHKRSLVLDYKRDAGRKALRRLLAGADVVLVNSRPGAAASVGLDYDTIHAINDRIVWCAITGFGETGPYALRPAFDNVGQALSGWMSRYRTGDDPRVAGPTVSDAATGMHAALGIMAALLGRVTTGKGAKVEVNMIESTIALGVEPLTQYLATSKPVPVFQRAAMSQAYTVTCSDGKRIGLHLSSPDKFWQSLCKAIDRPEWMADYPARMDRVHNYEHLATQMNVAFAVRTREEWVPILASHDVPFAPELALEELQDDPQIRHLGVFHDVQHAVHGTSRRAFRPVRIDGRREASMAPAPDLGEHTSEVLLEAGFTESQVAELRSAGVLGEASNPTANRDANKNPEI